MWEWYETGGYGHVAAYLTTRDISKFNAKAPPPKTAAFWDIVNANRAPEASEMADVLDKLGNPDVVTLDDIEHKADSSFELWLRDRRNRRLIPHRFQECGYAAVPNPDSKQQLWVINGKRQVVYGKRSIDRRILIGKIQEAAAAAAEVKRKAVAAEAAKRMAKAAAPPPVDRRRRSLPQ